MCLYQCAALSEKSRCTVGTRVGTPPASFDETLGIPLVARAMRPAILARRAAASSLEDLVEAAETLKTGSQRHA